MNSQFQRRLLNMAVLSTLLIPIAYAQDTGYYYGLGAGLTRAKIDEERITANLLANGASSVSMVRDESSLGGKLFGGYQFNRHLAVEGGYFNLGAFGFTSTTVPSGTLDGRIKLQGLNLDLVGTWPVTQRWSALGRVGAQYASARDTFRATGAVSLTNPNPSKSELNYKLGVGAQYAWKPSLLLRAEAERYRINDAVGNNGDVNKLSLSLVFPFGRTPEAVPAAAPVPVPVQAPAPAPAPAPVVIAEVVPAAPVPAPVAPVTVQRISLSADSLFNFDKSTFRPDAKASLDKFISQLQGLKLDSVIVEGHTDRLGSASYNQKLSLRRAESVKRYLVIFGGLDADKISTLGNGASKPVTKAEDCRGSKAAKLIACLQPDRRVDIQVTGLR
jgi:OmpA-OmpF porin, OOP family